MSNIIKFAEDAPKSEPWIQIGTGFTTKSGKGFNIVIGNEVPVEKGSKELKETLESVTLQPGDELYLGEKTGRDGQPIVCKNGSSVYRLQLKPRREEEKK